MGTGDAYITAQAADIVISTYYVYMGCNEHSAVGINI